MHRLFIPSLIVTLLTGCIGPDAQEVAPTGTDHKSLDEDPVRAPEEPVNATQVEAAPAAPTVLTWQGYMRAGAALELPAHWEETSGALRPVWSKGFEMQVEGSPASMEVTLSWTAPLARLFLMVTKPDASPMVVYCAPRACDPSAGPSFATDQSPICLAIPAGLLGPGPWEVMAHSEVAVDADLTFEVALVGGTASIVEEAADVPVTEFPFILATMETPEALPCAAA